jgi:hypothetical protein
MIRKYITIWKTGKKLGKNAKKIARSRGHGRRVPYSSIPTPNGGPRLEPETYCVITLIPIERPY